MENIVQALPEIGVTQESVPVYGCVSLSDSGSVPGLFAEMLAYEQGRIDCQTLPGIGVLLGDAETPPENEAGAAASSEPERIPGKVLVPILVDPFGGMLATTPPIQASRASFAVVPCEGSEEPPAEPQAVGTWRSGFPAGTAEYRVVASAAQTGEFGEAAPVAANTGESAPVQGLEPGRLAQPPAAPLPDNVLAALGSVADENGATTFSPAALDPGAAAETNALPGLAVSPFSVVSSGFATSGTAAVHVAQDALPPRAGPSEAFLRVETAEMGVSQPPDVEQPVAVTQSSENQPNGPGVGSDLADAQDVPPPSLSAKPPDPAVPKIPGTVPANEGESQSADSTAEAAETPRRALWAETAPKPNEATRPFATERMPVVQASKAMGALVAESEKPLENAVLAKFRPLEPSTAEPEADAHGTNAAAVSGKQNGAFAIDRANPAAIATGHSREAQSKSVVELPGRPTLETVGDHTVRSVRFLVEHGNSIVKVRLVPESLGELRIQIETSEGGMLVRLASANPAVRETLVAQCEGLRRSLVSQGIEVANVTVSADVSSNPGSGGFADRQPQHYGEPPRGGAPFTSTYRGSGPAFHPERRNPAHHDGLLNVLV